MKPFRKILAASDFGETSSRGLEIAADLARRYDAELVIVHVVEPPSALLPAARMPGAGAAHAAAELGLDAAVERAQEMVPTARGLLLDGHPAKAVLSYVEQNAIDLVVVGTHGRSRAGQLMMGSVAEKIVRSCRVPVLTVYDNEELAIARLAPDSTPDEPQT